MTWAALADIGSRLLSALAKMAGFFMSYLAGKRGAERDAAEDLSEKRKRELDAAVNSPRDPTELADRLRNGGGF